MDTLKVNELYSSPLIDTSNDATLNKSLNGMLNIMLEQNQTIKQQAKIIQDLQMKLKYIEKEIKIIKTDDIMDAHEVLKDELRKEMILFVASVQVTQNYPKKKNDTIYNQLYKKFLNIQTPYKEYNKIEDEDNIAKLSNRIVCQNGKNKELYNFLTEDMNKYSKNATNSFNQFNQMDLLSQDISLLKENLEIINNKLADPSFQISNNVGKMENNFNPNNKNNNKNDEIILLKKQMVQMEEDYHHIMMCVTQNRKQLEKKVDINYFKQELDSLGNYSTILENQNTINEIKNSLKKIQSDCSLLQPSDHSSQQHYQNEVVNKDLASIKYKYENLNSQLNTIKSALIANNILKINHETKNELDTVPVMSINLNLPQTNTINNDSDNDNDKKNVQIKDNANKDMNVKMNRMENILNYMVRLFNITSEDLSSNIIVNNNSPMISYIVSKLKYDTESIVEEKLKFLKEKLDNQINDSVQEVWNHLDKNIVPVHQQMGSVKNILTELTKKISYFQYSIGSFNENDERYFENNIQLLLNNNNSNIKYYKDKIDSQKYISLNDRINVIYDAIKQMIISNLYINRGSKESLSNDSFFTSHNDSSHNTTVNTMNSNGNSGNNELSNEILNETINKMLKSTIFKDKIINIIKESVKPKLLKIKNILHEKVSNDVLKELMKHLITREELKTELNHISYNINDRFSKIDDGNENCHCTNCIRKCYSCGYNNNNNTSIFNHTLDSNSNFHNIFKFNDTQKIFNSYIKKLIEEEAIHKNNLSNLTPKSTNSHNNCGNNEENNLLKVYINLLIKNSLNICNLENNNTSVDFNENKNNNNNYIIPQNMQIEIEKLENSFDEKLFLLASDINNCKDIYQQSLRKPFCQCGQWIWNSETLNFDSSIPWNIETYNTDGNNFIWEINNSNIKVQNEGIYEISFAFFTKVKPTIKLIINGETVMSAINSSSYVVHHSSGYVLANGKLKPGSATGLSLIDYLSLPSNSVISLQYNGNKNNIFGYGFIALKYMSCISV